MQQKKTDRDKRKQRRVQARLARKRRQRRIMTFMLICICVLLAILFAVTRKKQGDDSAKSGQHTDSPQDTRDSRRSDGGAGDESADTVTFSEAQKHTGDLILVNSKYPYDFDANADTISLVRILDSQSFPYQVEKDDYQVAGRIMPYLDEMLAACDEAVGSNLSGVGSAYRSIEYQKGVWNEMKELYGVEYAEKYVAEPGYSEHHTGLAVDVSIFYEDGSQGTFSESENAGWMNDNSCHYGFVRRYAEDKIDVTGISNEAWHFRYVGIPHAEFMVEKNLCLEEYIDYLRKNTSESKPLSIKCNAGTYEVFFTKENTIREPDGEYSVSGNNIDGYIVTVKME